MQYCTWKKNQERFLLDPRTRVVSEEEGKSEKSSKKSHKKEEMQFLATAVLRSLAPRGDDDMVDRLNYYYTVVALVVCTLVCTGKQYMGKPIHCWIPPQFTPSMEQYIEAYCWIQNTYWLPLHEQIPDDHQVREDRQIGYYQWTPFILALEALMFYFPVALWRLLNWQSGINIQYLVGLANDTHGMETGHRQRAMEGIAQNLQDVLLLQNALRLSSRRYNCVPRFFRGKYITTLYLVAKCLFALNVIGQFFLLNLFLKAGGKYTFYGVEVLLDLFSGRQWRESGHFPRITLCDIEVKYMGNLNRYTFQCALVVNLFNEKIFAFLWCWYLILSTITCCSLIFWIFNTFFSFQRMSFVAKYLKIGAERDEHSQQHAMNVPTYLCDTFINNYLHHDGVFILRMLANHTGDVITMDITRCLWNKYRNSQVEFHDGVFHRNAEPETLTFVPDTKERGIKL